MVDDAVHPNDAGAVVLLARQAKTAHGLKVESGGSSGLSGGPEEHLGYWTDPAGTAEWSIKTKTAGKFTVSLRLSAPDPSLGSVIEVVSGSHVLPLEVKPTGDWKKFADAEVGTIELPAGASTVSVRVKTRKGEAPCNLSKITLTPVK